MDNQQVVQPTTTSTEPITPPPSKSYLKFIFGGLVILAVFISGGLFLGKAIYAPKSSVTIQPAITPSYAITPSIIPTTDPTANWKTYTNTKYSFSIKYPNDWIIHIPERGNGADPQASVSFTNNQNNQKTIFSLYVEDKYTSIINSTKIKSGFISTEPVTIAGFQGISWQIGQIVGSSKKYFFNINGNALGISYAEGYEQYMNQILSTFKFL